MYELNPPAVLAHESVAVGLGCELKWDGDFEPGKTRLDNRNCASLAQLPPKPGFPWSQWRRTHHQR